MRKRFFGRGIFLAVFLFATATATKAAEGADENYPSGPVTIIVPYAEGGGLDTATRLLAKYAAPELGQPVQVVNITAGGNVQGNAQAVSAPPDGYTLGAWASGLVTDELLIRGVPYSHRDVRVVCLFSENPEVIAVGRHFAEEAGIATLEDLFDHVRANPGAVTLGVGGNWTAHDFLRIKMERQAGVKFNRMPFLGGFPALQAAAEGNCNVALPFISELLRLLDSGDVVPLAAAFHERLPQLPDVPSVVEAGYPDMTQTVWRVLSVPKGTPDGVVRRLEEAFRKAAENPLLLAEAETLGVYPAFLGSEEGTARVAREYVHYLALARELGILKNPPTGE